MVRSFSFIIFILFSQTIFSQQNGTLFLSAETLGKYEYSYEVDQYSTELYHPERFSNSDWKYHSGDDMKWKDPLLSDSNWISFNTDFDLDSIEPGSWQGIGWFRLKLIIDSSLFNRSIALVINHYGASELYMDGRLINQYGVPSMDPAIEKTYHPLFCKPLILSLDSKREHLLAVRYSFLSARTFYRKYKTIMPILLSEKLMGFSVHFGDPGKAVELYGESLTKNLLVAMITLSVLILITAYHLFLYRYYVRQRSNLYIAIFNFIIGAFTLGKFLPTYVSMDLGWTMVNNIVLVLLGCFWIPAVVLLYYSVVYNKFPKYVWLYLCWMPLYVLMSFYDVPWEVGFAAVFISLMDVIRLFVRSVKLKQRHAWIIGLGVLISQAALTLWFYPWRTISTLPAQTTALILLYIIFLAVPLTMSVYNALTTAKTSIDLEDQLKEVKRLSVLSLAQEQEKQQILASQNVTLEKLVRDRTAELKESIENLKSTQSQLIQSEKMASLGELTAGIAHEIQNPLNFVNNFSEVNTELIDELNQEADKGNIEEIRVIAKNIRDNEQKINQHGKRADAIVKGMLQHSRTSSGQREPTDINALCDEYLRLAYHGLRAKDKAFNAQFESDFDPSIEKISVVRQDIGRVILNLISNAFYAVNEKTKAIKPPEGGAGYKPLVTVSTKKLDDKILIVVADNGNGVPQNIVGKIFQPFFTTKPTGQGTGLGLSLSYDIVKAHSGDLKLGTKEEGGSEFIISLPIH